MSILISRAKPNPAGKDRAGSVPLPAQLLGEWVDIQNNGPAAVTLAGVFLSNQEFAPGCVPGSLRTYWEGSSVRSLAPGQVVRIHTGRSQDQAQMNSTDYQGVNFHAFAEAGNFILNNRCGDNLGLWMKRPDGSWASALDSTGYYPNPGEGTVLNRVGGRLV